MTATAIASSRRAQHLSALEIANHYRLGRAALRATVADAGASHDAPARARTSAQALAAILDAPPPCVLGAPLDRILRWVHGIGPIQARHCARQALSQLYPDAAIDQSAMTTQLLYKQIGRLTARERSALAAVLRSHRHAP